MTHYEIKAAEILDCEVDEVTCKMIYEAREYYKTYTKLPALAVIGVSDMARAQLVGYGLIKNDDYL